MDVSSKKFTFTKLLFYVHTFFQGCQESSITTALADDDDEIL